MVLAKIKELINEFPELKNAYEKKINEGYLLKDMYISSIDLGEAKTCATFIDLEMKNTLDENILLNYLEIEDVLSKVKTEFFPAQKKIHPNLSLNKDYLKQVSFKKSIFRGYKVEEVHEFIEKIRKDYAFIEDILILENKLLKEEIKKLKEQ